MEAKRRRPLRAAAAGAILAFCTALASAQPYPNRPIKIIAPVQPGGGVDLVARTIADRIGKPLGQSIVVENLAGGGGVIASMATVRAAADGYTLMLGYVATHGTSPAVRKLPYDAVKDFTPIAMVAGTPNVLVVPAAVPAGSVKEFAAWVKSNPGKLAYGSAGAGSLTHLAMEQFKQEAGLPDITHVAYKGIGPAFTDILGGQTHALFPGLAAAMPHIKAGKVKPLAVTGKARHPLLPDTPTLEELGYKGFDGVQWYGIVGPANLPPAIVRQLNDEINKALAAPDLKERLSGEALDPMPMTPEAFGSYIRDDIAKWSALAKSKNIQID